jgi:hypothetical protein
MVEFNSADSSLKNWLVESRVVSTRACLLQLLEQRRDFVVRDSENASTGSFYPGIQALLKVHGVAIFTRGRSFSREYIEGIEPGISNGSSSRTGSSSSWQTFRSPMERQSGAIRTCSATPSPPSCCSPACLSIKPHCCWDTPA